MPLEPGEPAPTVRAPTQDGEVLEVDTTGPTVVYFYPKDETPGCTTEARQFEAERDTYDAAGVQVIGVSTDDVESHAAFCEAEGLSFPLLADPEGDLVDAFDVPTRRGVAARTTFVIVDDEIERVYEDVSPDGHARAVLQDLIEAGVASLPE